MYQRTDSDNPPLADLSPGNFQAPRHNKDFETLHAPRGDYQSKLQALLPYLAGLSGNLLKYSNIGRDLELKDGLVRTYTEMLETDEERKKISVCVVDCTVPASAGN